MTAAVNTPTSNGSGSPQDTTNIKSSAARRKFSIAIPDRMVNEGSPALRTPALSVKSPDEQVDSSNEGILAKTGRRRTFSTSSGDQDVSMGGAADNDNESANPRKRVNGDTPDYPRRRATIAVCFTGILVLVLC